MTSITEVRIYKNIPVPMRDGVVLRADHLKPVCDEPLPALVVRTPYLKESFYTKALYSVNELAFQGYHVLLCDVRGAGQSDGEFVPFANEREDGYDTIQWVSEQPWCNGKVGTFGYSYNGGQQILAASEQPPALAAAAPGGASGWFLPTLAYGVLSHRTSLFWYMKQLRNAVISGKGNFTPKERQEKKEEIEHIMHCENESECWKLPFLDADVLKIEGVPIRHFFNEWVDHCDDREYWERMGQPLGIEKVNVPCFFYTGWFDYMCQGVADNYTLLSRRKENPELAESHRLVLGPWIHTTEYGVSTDSNSGVRYGALTFPPNSGYTRELYDSFLRFYDRYLKGDTEADPGAPVKIYVMGDNVWREEQEWPLARTKYTPLYLDSQGDARTCEGTGRLSWDLPCLTAQDEYFYDPMNPCDNTDSDIHKGIFRDRKDKEEREDMLVYSTDILPEDVEVTGNVTAKLFIQSSAVDTDFFVRLVDVLPDGTAYSYLSGVFRMRYRDGYYESHYMSPGQVYPIEVKVGPISLVFRAGHRIRIEITSSDFPEYDRNLNTSEPMGYGKESVIARQTILHTKEYPSHLLLPVIPR